MSTSILLTFVSLLLTSADSTADRDAKLREAKRACLNGDATTGLAILTDLYVDTGDPTHIYNQGRCLEQNNRYEEAIGRFREYLRKVGGKRRVDKADRVEAEKHIEDCQALLAQNGKVAPVTAAVPPPPEVPPPSPPRSSPAPAPTPEPVAAIAQQPAAPPSTGSPGFGLRIAGIGIASVGGAALVAGLVLNLKANSMVRGLAPTYNRSDDSTGKTYQTLSMVGYGVGAACVAGGMVLYYLGWRAGRASQMALLPSFSTGSAGGALAGGF